MTDFRPWALVVLLCIAAGLSACGGDAHQSASATPPAAKALVPKSSHGDDDEYDPVVARKAAALNRPCALLSRPQVQAVVGEPMLRAVEAPQGPTCIYGYRSGKRSITMAFQPLDVGRVARADRHARGTRLGGHRAVCSQRILPTLYVDVSAGRTLVISAPCKIARRLAARALPHVLG